MTLIPKSSRHVFRGSQRWCSAQRTNLFTSQFYMITIYAINHRFITVADTGSCSRGGFQGGTDSWMTFIFRAFLGVFYNKKVSDLPPLSAQGGGKFRRGATPQKRLKGDMVPLPVSTLGL